MNIIETTAPISIENLKLYFENKDKIFLIDYDNSSIQEEKFLIYLSNLDLPCNIKFDINNTNHCELLKLYFTTKNLVKISALEDAALAVCFAFKKENKGLFKKFIEQNLEIIKPWISVLESMTLYNFYCINSEKFKNFVLQHEEKDCSNIGLNFVNLLENPNMNLLFENIDNKNLGYYKDFFNEYMFKGKNLYSYWANKNNPMFLLTWSIASGQFKELQSVTSV